MEIEKFTNINKLEKIWPKNKEVLSPFQTYIWNKLWIKHFGQGIKLQIFTFWEKSKLLGIAPLYENDLKLQFIGTPPNISDYLDLIYLTDDLEKQRKILSEFFAVIKQDKNTSINLQHLSQQSITLESVMKSKLTFMQEQETAPNILCLSSWEEYLKKLPRKKRHELKRKLKKLYDNHFQVIYLFEPKEIRKEIDVFIDLMKQSSLEKEKFMTPQKEAFFKDFSYITAKESLTLLSFLEIEGKKVASTLVFKHQNKLYLYNSGYNPEFKELSPSFLLTAFNIKYAIEKRFREFDFLRGDERYKYDLGATNRYIYNVTISKF